MQKKVSRQYRWQLKQKALKRCSQCGNKAVKKDLCLVCYEKRKERTKKYMRMYSKTEKWKIYNKKRKASKTLLK